jgi:uncharacterized C2H2 Zn-finger protein
MLGNYPGWGKLRSDNAPQNSTIAMRRQQNPFHNKHSSRAHHYHPYLTTPTLQHARNSAAKPIVIDLTKESTPPPTNAPPNTDSRSQHITKPNTNIYMANDALSLLYAAAHQHMSSSPVSPTSTQTSQSLQAASQPYSNTATQKISSASAPAQTTNDTNNQTTSLVRSFSTSSTPESSVALISHLSKDKTIIGKRIFACPHCPGKAFTRNSILQDHLRGQHSNERIRCPICPTSFVRLNDYKRHVTQKHPHNTACPSRPQLQQSPLQEKSKAQTKVSKETAHSSSSLTITDDVQRTTSPISKVVCRFNEYGCGKRFSRPDSLREHQRNPRKKGTGCEKAMLATQEDVAKKKAAKSPSRIDLLEARIEKLTKVLREHTAEEDPASRGEKKADENSGSKHQVGKVVSLPKIQPVPIDREFTLSKHKSPPSASSVNELASSTSTTASLLPSFWVPMVTTFTGTRLADDPSISPAREAASKAAASRNLAFPSVQESQLRHHADTVLKNGRSTEPKVDTKAMKAWEATWKDFPEPGKYAFDWS